MTISTGDTSTGDASTGPSLRHLGVFEMVAALQSVRKAADAVHLSQPAVTQAVSKLEGQVGAGLFERRSSGTYLSPAGQILLARTRSMFAQIEEALATFGLPAGKARSPAAIAQRITRPQIRGLTAIAGARSCADAARKVDISQASLHRAARELERNLGKPLFHKGPFGLVTTRGGSELARRLTLAMLEIEWGIEEIHVAAGRGGGRLRIGAMPLAGSILLAPALNALMARHPEAHVQVRTGNGDHLTKALQLGEIDLVVGLVRNNADAEVIEQEPLVASPYVVVVRANHPLSRKAKVTTADLEAYDWIVPMPGATRRATFDRVFASMRRPPCANIESYCLSTIRPLLCGSDRLTLLTRFEYEHERQSGALAMLAYGPIEPIHYVGITRRIGMVPTSLQLEFMELMRAEARRAERADEVERAA